MRSCAGTLSASRGCPTQPGKPVRCYRHARTIPRAPAIAPNLKRLRVSVAHAGNLCAHLKRAIILLGAICVLSERHLSPQRARNGARATAQNRAKYLLGRGRREPQLRHERRSGHLIPDVCRSHSRPSKRSICIVASGRTYAIAMLHRSR
jgi:hypothetical protein